jgi:hypothetical protein
LRLSGKATSTRLRHLLRFWHRLRR